MIKKLSLFSSLLLSTILCGQAPDIVVDWGPMMKAKEVDFNEIIGAQDDYYYTFGTPTHTGLFKGVKSLLTGREYNVSCYDRKTYRRKFKKVMDDFEFQGNNAEFKKAMINPKGEVVMYFVAHDRKKDEKYLLTRSMDEKGSFSSTEVIATINARKRNKGGFTVKTSKDSTLLMVYADPPYERKADEEFYLQILDRDHNLLWEKSIVLPYSDKYFTLEDNVVTNDGDVFVLGYSEPDKWKGEKKERKASNEDWKLYRISKDESDIVEYDLDLDDLYVSSANISADFGEGKMSIAGFYTDDRKGGIGGSLYYTIDQQTLEPVTTSLYEFDKTFLSNFMSDRKAEKGKNLHNFKFRDFIRREDGGAVVTAEQYAHYVHTYRSANGGYTTTHSYHYNDIIVININPDGSIEWVSHIPKEQKTTDDGGYHSGYLLIVEKDRLHFIYNDHRKNARRLADGKDIKNMGRPKKAVAVVTTVEGDGNVVYDQLFRNRDYDAVLVPKRSYQAERKEVIMFGERRSKSRFGKLSFQ